MVKGSSMSRRLQQNTKTKPAFKTSVRKTLLSENSSSPTWAFLDVSQKTPKICTPVLQRSKPETMRIFSSFRYFLPSGSSLHLFRFCWGFVKSCSVNHFYVLIPNGLRRNTRDYTVLNLSFIACRLVAPVKRNRISRYMWTCLCLDKS